MSPSRACTAAFRYLSSRATGGRHLLVAQPDGEVLQGLAAFCLVFMRIVPANSEACGPNCGSVRRWEKTPRAGSLEFRL